MLRLLLGLMFVLVGCVEQPEDPETATTDQALVQGAPQIISTTIDAPMVSGRYQLLSGKAYTVTVVVDAGTISYLTRVEPHALPPSTTVSPAARDNTIVAYAGTYAHTFTITPSTTGNYVAQFRIRDRGSNNIYNFGSSVAVSVSSALAGPRIASTTINAPIWAGRYQLYAGQLYQVSVRLAMGNVTYSARVEGNGNSATLQQSPSATAYASMPRFGGDKIYTFTMRPTTTGAFQVAFKLRDSGTGNAFSLDGGVAATVHGGGAPRITSTTIAGVAPRDGQYVLDIGRRYDVTVRVDPGTALYTAAVEVNDQLPAVPVSANLHNRITTHVTHTAPRDFHFTLTPTDVGAYQVGFMMRDCPVGTGSCTGNAFSPHAGIRVVAATPISAPGPLYGYVTDARTKQPMPGARVTLETGVYVEARSPDGRYVFPSVPAGSHTLTVTAPAPGGYSTTIVSHVTVPAAGIRVDADLEEYFWSLASSGITYARRIDYLRGRTLFHVVNVPRATAHVALKASPPGGYRTALQMASSQTYPPYGHPKVTINGGFFDSPGVDLNGNPCAAVSNGYSPMGYRWPPAGYPNPPCQFGASNFSTEPMSVLGITGTATNQTFQMVDKSIGFDTASWKWQAGWPIWDDAAPAGVSDVSYAIQAYPRLVTDGVPLWGEGSSVADVDQYWSRTAVGIKANGDLLLVVADGEGFHGSQGANMFVLSRFFQETLQATYAMGLDGGGSTSMVVYRDSTGTWDHLNTPTSENLNSLVSKAAPSSLLDFLMVW